MTERDRKASRQRFRLRQIKPTIGLARSPLSVSWGKAALAWFTGPGTEILVASSR